MLEFYEELVVKPAMVMVMKLRFCVISSPEDEVEEEKEADNHGRYNDIGPVASVSGNFLEACRAQLE